MAVSDILTPALCWSAGLALVIALYIYYFRSTAWSPIPKDIPWVPKDLPWHNWLLRPYTRIRAHLRDFTGGTDLVREGYEKYSKASRPFAVPCFITWKPEIVLPPSQFRWLVEQPDTITSIDKCLVKDLEFMYTAPGAWSFTRPFHVEAINKLRVESLIDDIFEEVQTSIDEQWGTNTTEWTEINVDRAMFHVLVSVTSRVVFGAPTCHNSNFLTATAEFINNIPIKAILISLTPDLLRPLLAPFLTRNLHRWTAECAKHTIPLIEQEMLHRPSSDQRTMAPPKTLLEQLSRLAARSTHAKDRDPFSLTSRLLALNFVAVHTSLRALVNALVDMSSPPASMEGVWEALRAEAEMVSRQRNNHSGWSKASVAQLVRVDSALRESLRISTFKARGVERIIVKKGGVALPSGEYLPEGTKVGVPVLPVHHDEEVYEEALRYDAFRFCAPETRRSAGRTDSAAPSGHTELINTSETFLAFGLGKHACPGRFIAACELKLIVAYLAMNYDIEPLASRPANARFSDASSGSMHNLRVRRREREC